MRRRVERIAWSYDYIQIRLVANAFTVIPDNCRTAKAKEPARCRRYEMRSGACGIAHVGSTGVARGEDTELKPVATKERGCRPEGRRYMSEEVAAAD
jgi:hypothetical protein